MGKQEPGGWMVGLYGAPVSAGFAKASQPWISTVLKNFWPGAT